VVDEHLGSLPHITRSMYSSKHCHDPEKCLLLETELCCPGVDASECFAPQRSHAVLQMLPLVPGVIMHRLLSSRAMQVVLRQRLQLMP
jgi:hypothetical protein